MDLHHEGTLRRKFGLIAAHVLMAAVFIACIALGFGYVVMRLWNSILPEVLHAQPLRYWQAVGLLILCRILVGSFHSAHGGKHRAHPRLKCCVKETDEAEEENF